MILTTANFQEVSQSKSLFSKIFGTNLSLDGTGRGLKAPNKFKNWVVNCYKELILHQGNQIKEKNREVRTSFLSALKTKYGQLIGNRMEEAMSANTRAGKALSGFRVRELISQAEAMQVINRRHNNTMSMAYIGDVPFNKLFNVVAKEMFKNQWVNLNDLRTMHSVPGETLRRNIMRAIIADGKDGNIHITPEKAEEIAIREMRLELVKRLPSLEIDSKFNDIVRTLSVSELKRLQATELTTVARKDTAYQALLAKQEAYMTRAREKFNITATALLTCKNAEIPEHIQMFSEAITRHANACHLFTKPGEQLDIGKMSREVRKAFLNCVDQEHFGEMLQRLDRFGAGRKELDRIVGEKNMRSSSEERPAVMKTIQELENLDNLLVGEPLYYMNNIFRIQSDLES